jgi:hypothetical protein
MYAPDEKIIYKICSEKGRVDRDNPKTENDWGRCSEEGVCDCLGGSLR